MFPFFTKLFGRKHPPVSENDSMKKFLVVGLGNIGPEYANTRHNIGFQILDTLGAKHDFDFEPARLGTIGNFNIKGRKVICLKPSTYMNRSGKALYYWLEKENIDINRLLVVTDDINLPFGMFRLKTKGSDGGHNGLKDIQDTLGTTQYPRFRFGIGSEFSKGKQVDYVLGGWGEDEVPHLAPLREKGAALIESFVLAGARNTMNLFNGDHKLEGPKGIDS